MEQCRKLITSIKKSMQDQNITFKPLDKSIISLRAEWLKDSEITQAVYGDLTVSLSDEDHKNWYNKYSNDNSKEFWFIVFNNKPLGVVDFTNIDTRRKQSNVFVMIGDKSHWGKGIGKRAIEYVISKAQEKNINDLYLEVYKGNTRAIKLYESMQFTITDRNKDELIMHRHIRHIKEQ